MFKQNKNQGRSAEPFTNTFDLDWTKKTKLINVGAWKPTTGLVLYDVLFPHVSHKFRARNFHIITYHVKYILVILFNPQYLQLTESSTESTLANYRF